MWERVALSRVWVEVEESGGEREFPPRPISLIAGVAKDRGKVEGGRRFDCAWSPEAFPRDCALNLSFLGVRLERSAGIASSVVGGTPRYNSA